MSGNYIVLQEEQADTMTKEDAMYFPFIASGFLFGLYLVFKIFGKVRV